jgi:tRNA A37 threonylcarbamoyladenosine dehydratase
VNYEDRFGGLSRLYGATALERLRAAHVCVVGLGGVGSWTVEALTRSGIGTLTLIDLDDICVTNTNRQLPALTTTVGQMKARVMADRVLAINPDATVNVVEDFLTPDNIGELLLPEMSFVVDAVDDAPAKAAMVLHCVETGTPLVLSGGAGGRRNASPVTIADITETTNDRLLSRLRKRLRQGHEFGNRRAWNIPAAFSAEPQVFPGEDGELCEARPGDGPSRLDCASGFGASAFVTGTYGFAMASVVVNALVSGEVPVPRRGT